MKKKIILVGLLCTLVIFLSGITYSFFNSNTTMTSINQGIASFIFETKNLDRIDLDLNGFVPGEVREYSFSVTNTNAKDKTSDVTVEYKLNIKTYHFMPLIISLFKINNEEEQLIGTCDETFARNANNELVCNMPLSTLINTIEQTDNYKLKIVFPPEHNDISYSNLVDYINIEIESWQKL